MISSRRRTAALGAAALALVAGGCGSSGSGSAPPAATDGAPSSGSTPGGGGPTVTPTGPSGGTGASYRPARGPRVDLPGLTARAPARWRLGHGFGPALVFADDPHYRDEIAFSDTAIYPGTSAARAARIVARDGTWKHPPRSLADATLEGEVFFHLTGPAAGGGRYDVYGHVAGDRLLELAFQTDERPARTLLIVGSVLASLHLRAARQ